MPGAGAQTVSAEILVPGGVLDVRFSEPVADERADEFKDWLGHVAGSVSDIYGRFPLEQVRIRLEGGSRVAWGGDKAVAFGRVTRRNGTGIDLFVDLDSPIEAFYADWTATHEFSHLLIPRMSGRHRWIAEGFASYYQNVIMSRAGQYTSAVARQKLLAGFERGRAARPELSPNEAARAGMRTARYKIYWSGAALFLIADVQLRQRSDGRESLDTVLGRFQHCCLPSGRRWSGPELLQQFDALIDEPVFMPLYRQYADAPGFPDVRVALAEEEIVADIFAVRTSPN